VIRIRCACLAAWALISIWLGSAYATKVEIPLPALSGSYTFSYTARQITREMILRFDRLPITIYGVSIRLQGYIDRGWWECDFGSIPIPVPIDMYFTATMADSVTGGSWRARTFITCPVHVYGMTPYPPCEFDVIISFLPVNDASWDFLRAGRAHIALSGEPGYIGVGFDCIHYDPEGHLYLATLVVDADYQIGARSSTWGGIKALFPR
jgi:hypothetical protein